MSLTHVIYLNPCGGGNRLTNEQIEQLVIGNATVQDAIESLLLSGQLVAALGTAKERLGRKRTFTGMLLWLPEVPHQA